MNLRKKRPRNARITGTNDLMPEAGPVVSIAGGASGGLRSKMILAVDFISAMFNELSLSRLSGGHKYSRP